MRRPAFVLVLAATAGAAALLLWQFRETPPAATTPEIATGGRREGSEASEPDVTGDRVPATTAAGGSRTAPPPEGGAVRDSAGTTTRVRGSVVDPSRRPLAGARVELFRLDGALFVVPVPIDRVATSDATGAFAFDDPPVGTPLQAQVSAAGFARARAGIDPLKDGEERALAPVALARAVSLRGTVTGEGDVPVAGAAILVDLLRPAPGSYAFGTDGSAGKATSDAAGRFAIGELERTQYRVRVRAPGYADHEEQRSLLALTTRDSMEVGIRLEPARDAATGSVRAGGKPLGGAVVVARSNGSAGEHRVVATTAADGRFRLEGLASRPYTVDASADGFHAAAQAQWQPGAGELVLELAADGAIACRVSASSGPPPPCSVDVIRVGDLRGADSAESLVKRAVRQEDGRFRADAVPAGRYLLEARSDAAALTRSAPFPVAAGETVEIELRLAAGGTIRGRAPGGANVLLAPADFDPTLSTSSAVRLRGLQDRSVRAGRDGGFALEHVAPGRYALLVQAPAGERVVDGIAVEDGATADVGAIEVAAGAAIAGHVLDVQGVTLGGVEVVARQGGAEVGRARSTGGGYFQLRGLKAGAVELEATPGAAGAFDAQRWIGRVAAEAKDGAEVAVDLHLKAREP